MDDLKKLNVRIQSKRSTSTEWETSNPILLDGEIIIVKVGNETRLKIGDGTHTYKQLPFIDEPLREMLPDSKSVELLNETSTTLVDGKWSLTSAVDSVNQSIATYVTTITFDSDITNESPVVLIKDEAGWTYDSTKRISGSKIYLYSNKTIAGNVIVTI